MADENGVAGEDAGAICALLVELHALVARQETLLQAQQDTLTAGLQGLREDLAYVVRQGKSGGSWHQVALLVGMGLAWGLAVGAWLWR